MELFDIVKRLTGQIQPFGDSAVDEKRFENMKDFCNLTSLMVAEIARAATSKDSQYASMKSIGIYADSFLRDELEIRD